MRPGTRWLCFLTLMTLALAWGGRRAGAAALDPTSFAALGPSPFGAAGTYTIDTGATPPVLTTPGHTTLTGVVAGGIAVFTFTSIALGSGSTLSATGPRPLALLSQGGGTIAGSIDGSGFDGSGPGGGAGGPGGGAGGSDGEPGGGPGGAGASPGCCDGSSGGGFGGRGGRASGAAGTTYGDLTLGLQGGSGGGGSESGSGEGGGGGGAVEIGAVGTLTIGGSVRANGGGGSSDCCGGGGGSGGGLFLHACAVTLSGSLSAAGGRGGGGNSGGGGGGGGRVAILTGAGGFTQTGSVNVAGGPSGGIYAGPGEAGVVTATTLLAPFAAFTAHLELTRGPSTRHDRFDLRGTFTLGACNTGLALPTAPVRLTLVGGTGSVAVTIPANAFTPTGTKGAFAFEGTLAGVALEVRIAPQGTNQYALQAEGTGAAVTGFANPVTVTLTIGADQGTTRVTADLE